MGVNQVGVIYRLGLAILRRRQLCANRLNRERNDGIRELI
jgi:hypothetical protein